MCDAISGYNAVSGDESAGLPDTPGIRTTSYLIARSALMQGFVVSDYLEDFSVGLLKLADLIGQDKLICKVDMQEDFDNIPTTLQRIFTGKNTGKQILKLCDLPLPINHNEEMEKLLAAQFQHLSKAQADIS